VIDPAMLGAQPPVLETERLRLRGLRIDDVDPLHVVFADPETMRWWSSPPHESPTVTAEMLGRVLAQYAAGAGIEWAITRRAEPGDVAVGKIGHWRWQRAHSRSEVGFVLRRDLWRQGLVTEALRAVVAFGFATLRLHSVEAQLDADNGASARTLERVGFRREGLLREAYWDGRQWRDTLVYGLVGKDWR
jgi:ribosomal-protein-alanine N-acetyltransferase